MEMSSNSIMTVPRLSELMKNEPMMVGSVDAQKTNAIATVKRVDAHNEERRKWKHIIILCEKARSDAFLAARESVVPSQDCFTI